MGRRLVFGLLAARCSNAARKKWNAVLKEQGIDGFFDFYPTETVQDLELRLAEMFHLGRAAYILGESLQTLVLPLLDRVPNEGAVDTIINEGGVLVGYRLGGLSYSDQLARWVEKSSERLSD